MGSYKVSYKVLRQQGDDMKAVAKLVDGYAEQVTKIHGKLGDDVLLAEVRKNLSKLREQLLESRTVMNTAGEFLVSSVDSYSDVEIRQVKKVDGTKAHNRDFYKNPVVVASAGGAAGGAVAAGAVSAPASGTTGAVVPEPSSNTVDYTDSSVNISYAQSDPAASAEIASAQPIPTAQPTPVAQSVQAVQPGMNQPVVAQPNAAASSAPIVPDIGKGMDTATKAAIGAAGAGVVAAGGIIGGRGLKKRRDAKNEDGGTDIEADCDDYDPERELEKALERVRELENEE